MKPVTFGSWLKAARRAKGLTQKQIQTETGIGVSHLSKIENGDIGMPMEATRSRLHSVLGTSDEDLVEVNLLKRGKSLLGETVYVEPESRPHEDEHVGLWLRGIRQGQFSIEEVSQSSGLSVEYLARLEAGLEPLPGYPLRESILAGYWITDDDLRPYYIIDEPNASELTLIRVHPDVASRYSEITEDQNENGGVTINHERAVGMLDGRDTAAVSSARAILGNRDYTESQLKTFEQFLATLVNMVDEMEG